jgi:hypothetical protein
MQCGDLTETFKAKWRIIPMRVSRFDQPGTVLWPDINVYSQMGWITDHWATYQEEPKQ